MFFYEQNHIYEFMIFILFVRTLLLMIASGTAAQVTYGY
jgi:hypothetical protein